MLAPQIKQALIFIIFITLYGFSVQSYALGKLGHQLVCQLAYEELSSQEQVKLQLLLTKLPNREKQRINRYLYQKPSTNISYKEACTWADAIKKERKYDQYKAWHYLNVPRDTKTLASRPCMNNCITQAIKQHETQFKKSHSTTEKIQALLFLGHWYGDIHQPFHIGFTSDRGGNKSKAQLASTSAKAQKCTNLHWIWDECLLYLDNKLSYEKLWQKHYLALKQIKAATSPKDINSWQLASINQMAQESFDLVTHSDMLYCVRKEDKCQPLNKRQLTSNYQKQWQPVLYERLLQAAVRLGYKLNQLLKEPELEI